VFRPDDAADLRRTLEAAVAARGRRIDGPTAAGDAHPAVRYDASVAAHVDALLALANDVAAGIAANVAADIASSR
jgi:hypothetical protein